MISMKARKELERISRMSGYSYRFLEDIYMEYVRDDGEADLKHIEDVSMERDW